MFKSLINWLMFWKKAEEEKAQEDQQGGGETNTDLPEQESTDADARKVATTDSTAPTEVLGKVEDETVEVAKLTEKTITNKMIFKCSNCGKIHFRHGGYVETTTPFVDTSDDDPVRRNSTRSRLVMFCVACKTPFINMGEKMFDASEFIDAESWEEFEKVAHKATGPGGEC